PLTDEPLVFRLTQRYFTSGSHRLVLEKKPEIAFYPGQDEFEIVGWNLKLPRSKQGEIGRELVRKFLILFLRAERSQLSNDEKAEWRTIVEQVDYRQFSIDRAPGRYVEGHLVTSDENSAVIEWHDGSRQKIAGPCVADFRILEPGEQFSAMAWFGRDNIVLRI